MAKGKAGKKFIAILEKNHVTFRIQERGLNGYDVRGCFTSEEVREALMNKDLGLLVLNENKSMNVNLVTLAFSAKAKRVDLPVYIRLGYFSQSDLSYLEKEGIDVVKRKYGDPDLGRLREYVEEHLGER